jgi:hypothetical protein
MKTSHLSVLSHFLYSLSARDDVYNLAKTPTNGNPDDSVKKLIASMQYDRLFPHLSLHTQTSQGSGGCRRQRVQESIG